MTPKLYPLLERCVEEGITLGLARAAKLYDNPTDEQRIECIFSAVMCEFYEWFDFPPQMVEQLQ